MLNPIPLRPTHAVINLNQLRRNVEAIPARVFPAKVLVMLKANAYGHGIDGVAPYIEPFVDAIGVSVLLKGSICARSASKNPSWWQVAACHSRFQIILNTI